VASIKRHFFADISQHPEELKAQHGPALVRNPIFCRYQPNCRERPLKNYVAGWFRDTRWRNCAGGCLE